MTDLEAFARKYAEDCVMDYQHSDHCDTRFYWFNDSSGECVWLAQVSDWYLPVHDDVIDTYLIGGTEDSTPVEYALLTPEEWKHVLDGSLKLPEGWPETYIQIWPNKYAHKERRCQCKLCNPLPESKGPCDDDEGLDKDPCREHHVTRVYEDGFGKMYEQVCLSCLGITIGPDHGWAEDEIEEQEALSMCDSTQPLCAELKEELSEIQKRTELLFKVIDARVGHIVAVIAYLCDLKSREWDWRYDMTPGQYARALDGCFDFTELPVDIICVEGCAKAILAEKVVDLRNGIPSRWLFEDFEGELEQGINRFKNQGKQVLSARSKLSEEELIALRAEWSQK
jgi:hypothetical protein